MEIKNRLLFWALDWHKAHIWTTNSLTDCFGIV
jgi:hypothetical protein